MSDLVRSRWRSPELACRGITRFLGSEHVLEKRGKQGYKDNPYHWNHLRALQRHEES